MQVCLYFLLATPLPTIYPQQGKEFKIRSSKSQRAEIVSVVGGWGVGGGVCGGAVVYDSFLQQDSAVIYVHRMWDTGQ